MHLFPWRLFLKRFSLSYPLSPPTNDRYNKYMRLCIPTGVGRAKQEKKNIVRQMRKKTLIIMINKYKRTRLYFSFTSPVINVGRHGYAFLFVFRPPQRNGRGQHDGHEPVWVVATGTMTTVYYDTRRFLQTCIILPSKSSRFEHTRTEQTDRIEQVIKPN